MGGDDKFVFAGVSELTGDLFDRFYHTVLEPAFPPEELEDIETVRALHYEPSPCVPGLVCLDPWRESVPKDTVRAFLDEYVEAAEGSAARSADPEYLNLRGQVDSWPKDIPLWPLSRATQLPAPGQVHIFNDSR
jgi:hypothetical protein